MQKLQRVLSYLRQTPSLGLEIMKSEDLHIVAYIDASYAVHHDRKSHTGVIIKLGGTTIYASSSKQGLNSKSSTEAEIIALSDGASQVLWTRLFLGAQGYPLQPSKIFQDNMSVLAMIKKGRPTSKHTRHIDCRYFFVHDRVTSDHLLLEYKPTEGMLADFLTKPQTGTKFQEFRSKLLLTTIE